MRAIILSAILSAIFVAIPNKTASSVQQRPTTDRRIVKVIKELQPKLSDKDAEAIATIVSRNSAKTGIEWRLVVAILFQESSLKIDPQNCKVNFTRCNDMGIGQVRYSVWGKELKIDKKRMVTDLEYAIGKVYKVLGHYREKYGQKELNWFTRYHHGDPSFRFEYMKRLNRAYAKINAVKD